VATAAIVVSWEGGAATERCVASLLAQEHRPAAIVIVDNASGAAERERLVRAWGDRPEIRLLLLDANRVFAGGLNAGAAVAFAAGATRVLCLNNDTVLAPDVVGLLEAALAADPAAGIAGPRVLDVRDPRRELSAGERYTVPLLCVPRTLLRHRGARPAPYPVSGVMGCAFLVTRECFVATGGLREEIQVYYEEVDFCLAARARGFGVVVESRAVVYHDGLRGFLAGLTPWAAFLKARNPWLVVRRFGGLAGWLAFVPTYGAMVASSALLYGLRGEGAIVAALARGALAGLRAAAGGRVTPVGAPRPTG